MYRPKSRLRPVFASFAVLLVSAAVADAADIDAGEKIYQSTCAVCHGANGTPDPDSPVVKGLGVLPADLSDPLFNSREPTGDWEMVVKYGGHALGLSEKMPPQEGALTDEQVADVTAYVKSLADTSAFPPGEMNLFLPVRTKKAFPEDEVVYKGIVADHDGERTYRHALEIEKRFGKRGQGILELVHLKTPTVNEITLVEVGYKYAFAWTESQVFSGAAVLVFPTSSENGEELIQTYLAYGAELAPEWTFQSSLRFTVPFDKASDGLVDFAAIVHYVHSPWPRRVFPALEVVAAQPFDSSNGDFNWSLLPQVRIGLTRGGHVALNLGVEYPMTDRSWDRRYYVTLLWDFADGGFFKGW